MLCGVSCVVLLAACGVLVCGAVLLTVCGVCCVILLAVWDV